MRRVRLLAAVLGIVAGPPALGQDTVVRVFDAALNKVANRVQPITIQGRYRAVASAWGLQFTLCDSPYTVRLSQLQLATSPVGIAVTGRVDATWCGLSFATNVSTTAQAVYSPAARAILITVLPINVQPRFNILGVDIPLPVSFNVATSSSAPLRVGGAQLAVQGVHGPVALRVQPQNVSVTSGPGYLELRCDLGIW